MPGCIFYRDTVSWDIFIEAQCRGVNFGNAQCQAASFIEARCQGASFIEAWCQGASFIDAQCQGAYATGIYQSLSDRMKKPTELKNMIIVGEFSGDDIQSIDMSKEYCSKNWYKKMQGVIEDNKGKKQKRDVPEGIIEGYL